MIACYSQNKLFKEAIGVFKEMIETPGVSPDEVTMSSILSACAHLEVNCCSEVRKARSAMKGKGVQKKCAGSSWIEMDGNDHDFVASDESYPLYSEIYTLLSYTITVMTSLVALSFYGASQLKFHWVERNDKLLVGSVLCLVGVLTFMFHDHEHDIDGISGGQHLHHRKLVL
ncbi:hypothetical protein GIB67_032892 [Kingdonia uniflora]|uniref:Pentatricopeptide repeat-containing protein n=1 Tax=Kingdonia uniflora TaxID=39325 RepID=A0A7J7KV58_9MAGN|nr:hypothetical protein GIB67_032892 [Kingdonia uniflora]